MKRNLLLVELYLFTFLIGPFSALFYYYYVIVSVTSTTLPHQNIEPAEVCWALLTTLYGQATHLIMSTGQ